MKKERLTIESSRVISVLKHRLAELYVDHARLKEVVQEYIDFGGSKERQRVEAIMSKSHSDDGGFVHDVRKEESDDKAG